MQSSLQAGAARADITPDRSLPNYNGQLTHRTPRTLPLRSSVIVCRDSQASYAIVSIDATFLDAPLAKQCVVARAATRVGREQHQPCRVAIDPVQRHQRVVPGPADQTAQQGFMDVGTGRRDRQEMRLVRHQQVGIGMQHDFIERNRWFVRNFAVVMHFEPDPMRCARGHPSPVAVDDPPVGHPLHPLRARHRREPRAQAIQHRRPRPGRQLQRACGEAVDARGALAHGGSVMPSGDTCLAPRPPLRYTEPYGSA